MKKDPTKPHYIYSLTDRTTLEIIYIGCTKDFKRRCQNHFCASISESDNIKFKEYLVNAKQNKCLPKAKIIKEFTDYKTAHSMEVVLIKRLKPLFNVEHNRC